MAEHHNITQEVLKTLKEQLTCGICLDSYRDPRLLQCFHVFCKDCLERLVVQDHQGLSLSCPNCRQSSLFPPGSVSGLQSAFHTNHLFEIQDALQKLKESHKTKCEKCEMQIATADILWSADILNINSILTKLNCTVIIYVRATKFV